MVGDVILGHVVAGFVMGVLAGLALDDAMRWVIDAVHARKRRKDER